MTMPRKRLGRTGLEIPVLTFGGGWVGGLLIDQEEDVAIAALDRAWNAGMDWIDTAALYGQGVSEQVIGVWMDQRPADKRPRVSTKFRLDPGASDLAGQMRRSVEESLRHIGVSRTPLLFMHNPLVSDVADERQGKGLHVERVLEAGGVADEMEKLREEGLCDNIGMTGLGDPKAVIDVVDSGRFDVAQIYYNMLNPTAAVPAPKGWNSTDFGCVLHRCAAQDMGVMGIRIFAAGHLATDVRHGRELPITENAQSVAEEARMRAIKPALREGYGTRAQMAIRFGFGRKEISSIVVGMANLLHLDEALSAAAAAPLPEEITDDLAEIRAVDPAFVASPNSDQV